MNPAAPPNGDLEIALFEQVRALPAARRESFLTQECSDSPVLLSLVRERLAREAKMNGFLLTPVLSRSGSEPSLHVGDLAASRFKIRREIAEGGMAVVYEAFDQKLGISVALKVPKFRFRRRLLQELRSALQVTHPNICRLYEVHSAGSGDEQVEFLTMEYLEGETLADFLKRGRPKTADALRIACQICEGLGEAHSRNIVHGDLKPSNVILTKNEARAVITDFGLACNPRDQDGEDREPKYSLRGTLDYAAPELLQGCSPTAASDIYALGVILHELMTGVRTSEDGAGGHLAKLPAQRRNTVKACLAKDPRQRPATAGLVSEALCKKSRVIPISIAAAFLVVAASAAVMASWQFHAVSAVVRLAILPAETDSAAAMIGGGVSEDLSERLRGSGDPAKPLIVIPVRQAERFHVGWSDVPKNVLGATHTLLLRFTKTGREITVNGEIHEAATNRIVRSFHRAWNEMSLGEFPDFAAVELSRALNRTAVVGGGMVPTAAYLPYAQAIYLLRKAGDRDLARRDLQEAQRLAPANALIGIRLIESELLTYAATKSPEVLDRVRRALDSVWTATPSDMTIARLSAALTAEANDPEAAMARYRAALAKYPADGELWRAFGEVLHKAGKPDSDAISAYGKSMELEPDYFQPFLDLGVLFFYRGRYTEARDQFMQAARLAPGLALPHRDLASTFAVLGRYDQAEQEYHQALNIERTPDTFAGIGAMLEYQHRHEESVHYYEQAVSRGPEDCLLLSNLADSYRRTGRAAEAKTTYSRVVDAAKRRLGADPSNASDRAFEGYGLARLGDTEAAIRETESAIRLAPRDVQVRRRAIATFEALLMRAKALDQVRAAPVLISELSRQTDLADLLRDPRFKEIERLRNADKGKKTK